MNYEKIYDCIIKRAKTRKLEGYVEKHHIIPKCMGGSNEKQNIVELTAREHFLCHLLLCEIYPNIGKLVHAIWMMSNNRSKNHKKDYTISSRLYERLRIEHSKIMSEKLMGSNNPMFGKIGYFTVDNKGSKNPMFGKLGEENPNFGKKYPEHSERMKKNNPMHNKEVVERVKLAISKPRPKSRVPKPKKECPYCGLIGGAPVMMRYHFDHCKHKVS
jgi:hypothetical protein